MTIRPSARTYSQATLGRWHHFAGAVKLAMPTNKL